ncbi:hypothetical protein ABE288_14960 [Bacillus salipaludis]|uniref:hypothetical protein n=1 Tax=Bacillus salipaludis TaxID=2547811 RepID=UPI003D1FD898
MTKTVRYQQYSARTVPVTLGGQIDENVFLGWTLDKRAFVLSKVVCKLLEL